MPNTTQPKAINPQVKPKSKSRINKRQRNRRRNKQKLLNNQNYPNKDPSQNRMSFSQSAHLKGKQIWGEAYINAVRWHSEHQNNFWRHAAEQLQHENQMLRQQLANAVVNNKPETEFNYETSDEDEDEAEKDAIKIKKEAEIKCKEEEDEDEVDLKYLEFMEVTIKHREELRLKREAADLLEETNL